MLVPMISQPYYSTTSSLCRRHGLTRSIAWLGKGGKISRNLTNKLKSKTYSNILGDVWDQHWRSGKCQKMTSDGHLNGGSEWTRNGWWSLQRGPWGTMVYRMRLCQTGTNWSHPSFGNPWLGNWLKTQVVYNSTPTDRWADWADESNPGTIPSLLHQLSTGQLGWVTAFSPVCIQ